MYISADIQHGHEAWICMHGNEALDLTWICSMDMQRLTCSMYIQLGQVGWTSRMDMQGHAAWRHGHGAWTHSITMHNGYVW